MNILYYSPYVLFVTRFSIYSFIIFKLIKYYHRQKFHAYIYLTEGFFFAILSSILILFSTFDIDYEVAVLLNKIIVLLYFISFILWTLGLYLLKHDRLPLFVYLFLYLVGIVFAAYYFSDITFMREETINQWQPVVPNYLAFVSLPIIILPMLSFTVPIIKKYQLLNDKELKKDLLLVISGIFVIFSWGIVISIFNTDSIWFDIFEGFMIPIGWLLFLLGTRRRPLIILLSNAKPIELLVVSNLSAGVLFHYMFSKESIFKTSPSLISALLTSINIASSEVFQEPETLRKYLLDNITITLRTIPDRLLTFILVTKNQDEKIEIAFTTFIHLVLKNHPEISHNQSLDLEKEVNTTFNILAYGE